MYAFIQLSTNVLNAYPAPCQVLLRESKINGLCLKEVTI